MVANRLQYFCVLTQTGNMRKAAEHLRISPQALSKAVRVLETELGFKLILPSGRGIVITDRGQRLAKNAARLLEELDALRKPEFETEVEQPLRIGSFEVFSTYFMGEAIRRFFPDIPVSIRELIPGHIELALSQGQINLGITYIPVPSQDLDHLRVAEIEMGVFGRADMKGAHGNFSQLPFAVPITPLSGSPNKALGLDGWPDDRIPRNAKYRVTLMETAMELCRRGQAVAYLPRFVAQLHNRNVLEKYRLTTFPMPKGAAAQKQAVYLVKRKSNVEDQRMKKLAKAIRLVTASG